MRGRIINVSISPIREELGALLCDPVFARSPALSRLLAYLVEASASGEGAGLKSYTVAVEGLGKSADFDPQIDTSARVLVARLRRALDTFYAGDGADRAVRLSIARGSYEVRLEGNPHFREPREDPAPEPLALPAPAPLARQWWPLALLLLALIASTMAAFWPRPSAEKAQWNPARFPSIYFAFEDDGTPLAGELLDTIRPAATEEADNYEVIRPVYRPDQAVNYIIKLRTERRGQGLGVEIEVVDVAGNKIIYAGDLGFANRQDFDANGMHRISETLFNLLGYRGVIVSQERKRVSLDDGAYGCWLRFSADALADGGMGDRDLDACAARWHAHAPAHPVATAIYGWTLVNGTFGDLSAYHRKVELDQAAAMLERAVALNPDSRHALMALARTYAFMGDDQALRGVSSTLAEKGRFNLDIMNTVGTFLVLQNNPKGIELIDHAISHNPDPPPRYFVGKFIAGMMKDDLPGAHAAIMHIQAQGHSSVFCQIFEAAYDARIGQLGAARASWDLAAAQKPILRLNPGAFMATLPATAEVRDKLRAWLKPAVPRV